MHWTQGQARSKIIIQSVRNKGSQQQIQAVLILSTSYLMLEKRKKHFLMFAQRKNAYVVRHFSWNNVTIAMKGVSTRTLTTCASVFCIHSGRTYQFAHRQRCKHCSLQRHSEEYSLQGTWKQHLDLRNRTHIVTCIVTRWEGVFFLFWILQ